MANVTAYKNKDGVIVSYRFRACIGRDEKGKQQFVTKTEKPPIGLTPKKAEKEMQDMKIYEEPIVTLLSLECEDILTSSDNFMGDIFFE